jgi:hypothetical protein
MKKTVRLLLFFLSCTLLGTQSIVAIDFKQELNNYFARLKRGIDCYRFGKKCTFEDKETVYNTIRNTIGTLLVATLYIYREPVRKFLFRTGSQGEYRELHRLKNLEKDYKEKLNKAMEEITRLESLQDLAQSAEELAAAQRALQEERDNGLYYAIASADLNAVKYLLDKNANPNYRKDDYHVLAEAIDTIRSQIEKNMPIDDAVAILNLLIKNGADLRQLRLEHVRLNAQQTLQEYLNTLPLDIRNQLTSQ